MKRLYPARQGKAPAGVMGHRRRIIERIAPRMNGCLFAGVAQYPLLLEPCDVANLPEQGIDDGQARTNELTIREVRDKVASPLPSLPDPVPELGTRYHDVGVA